MKIQKERGIETMENMEIRIEMTRHGLKQWQVANLLGVSESVFSRMLRKELSEEEKERILKAIKGGVSDYVGR